MNPYLCTLRYVPRCLFYVCACARLSLNVFVLMHVCVRLSLNVFVDGGTHKWRVKRGCQNFWTHGLRERERARDEWRGWQAASLCLTWWRWKCSGSGRLPFVSSKQQWRLSNWVLMVLALKRARIQALSPPLSLSLALTALDRRTSQIPKASEAYLKIHVILAWPSWAVVQLYIMVLFIKLIPLCNPIDPQSKVL